MKILFFLNPDFLHFQDLINFLLQLSNKWHDLFTNAHDEMRKPMSNIGILKKRDHISAFVVEQFYLNLIQNLMLAAVGQAFFNLKIKKSSKN